MTHLDKPLLRYTMSVLMVSVIALTLISYCTSPVASGSGTGVGNGVIIGKVIYPDSTPAKNASVILRAKTYLADTSGIPSQMNNDTMATLVTNGNGEFTIDSVYTGYSYCIEVNDHNANAMGTLFKVKYNTSDTVKLTTRIMEPVAKVQGTIVLHNLPQNAYVQIYGMEHVSKTDVNGNFEITELPLGKWESNECEYKLRIFIPQPDGTIKTKDYELELETDSLNNIGRIEFEKDDGVDEDDSIEHTTFSEHTLLPYEALRMKSGLQNAPLQMSDR
jgi:hypothetical protein